MDVKSQPPYTAEELYEVATREAEKVNIPEYCRDDAIQEFVVTAVEAGKRGGSNPRGYQFVRGRGAMCDYAREEQAYQTAVPPQCGVGARRLSFDQPMIGAEGEMVTLAEMIPDGDAAIPGEEPSPRLDGERIHEAISLWDRDVREAAMRVLVEGESQEEAATALGKTRRQVQRLLDKAREAFAGKNPEDFFATETS